MVTIVAEFDGSVFARVQPIELPAGTKVEIQIDTKPNEPPLEIRLPSNPPQPPTEEEKREWEELMRHIAATEPEFPTVEEAMRYTRKRP